MDRLVVMILFAAKCIVLTSSSFPDNVLPLRELKFEDVSSKAFTGDDVTSEHRLRHIQLIKKMKILGEEKIVICAREDIFIINPDQFSSSNPNDITYDSVVTWKSETQTRDLCIMKGQPDELCYNYNSVFEALDEQGNEFLVCGTDSYNPNCTKYQAIKSGDGRVELINFGSGYFSGKQRCPFGPNQPSASLFTGNSLYSGTFQAFSGGSPVISRTMGDVPPLRTPDATETINEPSFVGMAEDEDRVFVFFNEIQLLPGGERRVVAQVGQVCKRDIGGERVLQRIWTSFIKSRLNCSYNGFYLNELRDVTKPTLVNGQVVIYATFVTPENSLPGSAVCSYKLDSIREALQGPFLAQTSSTSAPPKSRHPGLCSDEKPSDAELLFIKSSPQMLNQVKGSLLMTYQGTRYTTSVVDSSPSDKDLKVFYIGDEEGKLVRRLAPSNDWKSGAVLSVQDAFDEKRCSSATPSSEDKKVVKILLDSASDYVTVAFKHCTVSIPLHSCQLHQCKSTCIGSGDPYCGWNGTSCVAFQETQPSLNQDLRSAINSPQLFTGCELPTSKSETSTQSLVEIENEFEIPDKSLFPEQQVDDEKEVVGPEQLGDPELEVASFGGNVLAIAIVLTFTLTVLVMLVAIFFCRWRRDREKYDFHQKQMMQHQQNLDEFEKRGSLSRRAQITYDGCLEWLFRPPKPTPAPTPKTNNKSDEQFIPSAKQNNYSEAPTLQLHVEQAKKQRRSSSRLNSTSSVNSNNSCVVPRVMRQESIVSMSRRPSSHQPLLTNQTYEAYEIPQYDGTIQRQLSEAPTLPAQNKRSSHASSSGSGGSPISNESHLGAAETGILPTASAKMRRRNERAQNQTNEIMRESDTAIMDFQNALGRMEIMGITNHHQPVNIARQRLDSNDSGKGESPRNSLRTDLEQSVASITSRHPRPNSLNLQRSTSCRRQRLLSEPSYSPEAMSAFVPPIQRFHSIQPQPQTPNGRHSRSQPTTPVGGPSSHKLVVFQPAQEQSVYATLPKHDVPVTGRRKQRMSGDSHQQMYVQQRPVSTDVSNQRRSSTASRPNTSPAKVPPNRYPSLQVRGPYATKPSLAPVVVQQPASRNTPPKNHYPSLPHRSSSAPFGNNTNTFERPSTLHRREKMPSFLRQSSMPGGAPNKPTFYPTPIVPISGVEAL